MKQNLQGLSSQAAAVLRRAAKGRIRKDDQADLYAYSLEELVANIEEVRSGKSTLQEFAEHYCLTKKESV